MSEVANDNWKRVKLFTGFWNYYFIEETAALNTSTEQRITMGCGNQFHVPWGQIQETETVQGIGLVISEKKFKFFFCKNQLKWYIFNKMHHVSGKSLKKTYQILFQTIWWKCGFIGSKGMFYLNFLSIVTAATLNDWQGHQI